MNKKITTYPNQRTVLVHRERVTTDFLGIKNENWMAAATDLGAHAFMLYLYLAANADNFKLALSPVAIAEAIGMPRSTYSDQFRKLVNKGYLVQNHGNTYDFYEVPQTAARTKMRVTSSGQDFTTGTSDGIDNPQEEQNCPQGMGEINNKEDFTNRSINKREDQEEKEESSRPKVREITIGVPEVKTKVRDLYENIAKETFVF